jgi:biotin/methionine sulfoxide reductase
MTQSTLLTHWGPFLLDTEDNKVVDVRAHPADPDPSPLGQSLRQSQQCRVARPSVRRSWLEHGPGTRTDQRGHDPFVEVDWDEALDMVASELARIRDTHGHRAIFGGSYGWSSAGRFHMSSGQTVRFFRQFGGYTDAWGTYSSSAAEAIVPYVLGIGYHQAVAQQTSWHTISEHCELFVSFGGLRVSNTQVTYGGQGPHHTGAWLERCRERDVAFINISPLRDDLDAGLAPRWIHPTPGTDVALMAAIIHTLVVDGMHDRAFLETYCTGWDRLEAYLLGHSDGVEKSAQWASGITGLASDTITSLAREMRAKRTLINLTLAVQRQDHGEQSYWMAIALAAALGQIGLPGGGVAFTFGSAGNTGAGQTRKRIPGLPMPKRPSETTTISVSRITELLEANGGTFDFNGAQETFPDTRMVYWCGGNVFHHHQDLNRLLNAWQRPDTIVVHEPFWTPMAKRADIVLPATTPLERNDIGGGDTMLVAMTKVLQPYEQARDDFAIYAGLAHRLGFGDDFTQGRSADEWVAQLYEDFRLTNNDAPPYEEFRAQGTLHHDMPAMGSNPQTFLAQFRADPTANPLPTPSGRIELFSATIAGYGYDDCPGHPVWLEPFERLGTCAAQPHPLHLVSNQPARRLHSQYDHGETSQATKIDGREPCRMNPQDAAARGIKENDVVRVFNDRGACLAAAQLTGAVMIGALQLSTGAWYDPDADGMCKHGNPNVLTRDKGTSKLAQGPSAHTCLVQVERFKGPVPSVTAFDPPPFVPRP